MRVFIENIIIFFRVEFFLNLDWKVPYVTAFSTTRGIRGDKLFLALSVDLFKYELNKLGAMVSCVKHFKTST